MLNLRSIPIGFLFCFLLSLPAKSAPFRYVGSFGEAICDTATMGDTTYYAQGAMIRIVAGSDPTSSTQVGALICDDTVFKLRIYHNALFACFNTPDGCSIGVYDISQPRSPRLARTISFPVMQVEKISMELLGHILWVMDGTHFLHIDSYFDVSNPLNPTKLSTKTIDRIQHSDASNFNRGGVIFTTSDGELMVVDGNTSSTVKFAHDDEPIQDVQGYGDILYAVGTDSLYVFEISTAKTPKLEEKIKLSEREENEHRNQLYKTGTTLWNWTGGRYPRLRDVYDIANPLHPVAHPTIKPMPISTAKARKEEPPPSWMPQLSFILDMQTTDSTACFVTGFGLYLIDFSDPAKCLPLGSLQYDKAEHLIRSGSLIYLSSAQPSFAVVDVSNPKKPALVNDFDLVAPIQSMCRADKYIFAASGSTGLLVIDASNPTSPTLVASQPTASDCSDVVIAGHYALVAAGKLQILDIADPLHPKAVKELEIGYEPANLIRHNDLLFVTGDEEQTIGNDELNTCAIVDISDPANPRLLPERFKYPGTHMALLGNLAVTSKYTYEGSYNTYRTGTLSFYDITDPLKPVSRGSLTPPWGPSRIFLNPTMLFVCVGDGGFMIYRQQ